MARKTRKIRKPQQPVASLVAAAQQAQDYAAHGALSQAGRRVCLAVSNRTLGKLLLRGMDDRSRAECIRSMEVNLRIQRRIVSQMPRMEWKHYIKSLHKQSAGF